jgi:anti-sigma regulatory factor (Ser/Thr protein kinase)
MTAMNSDDRPGPERHSALGLPPVPDACAKARRWIENKLGSRLDRDRLMDARLVVTELVTNALLHTHSGILRVELDDLGGSFEIAVVDDSEDMPAMREREPSGSSGRGLRIVDEVSDVWGAAPEPPGKRVWARLSA